METASGSSVTVHTTVYTNRTRLYLAPVVNTFDNRLAKLVNDTTPIAWGINDLLYFEKKVKLNHGIFILHQTKGIAEYLRHIKTKSYFVDDYIFELRNRDIHMSVLRVTRPWRKTHDAFVAGRFSEMYTDRQLKRVKIQPRLATGKPNAIYDVLTKNPEYRATFEQMLMELYGVDCGADGAEYDSFSFSNCYEVFNAPSPPGIKSLI